ncbi:MAG: hypothetical protein ACFFCI_18345 [Promethearchaeota archaeon]
MEKMKLKMTITLIAVSFIIIAMSTPATAYHDLDQLVLLHSYDFEEDIIGQDPTGITLSVNEPAGSGSVNIDNLGDVQQNHVALHKSGGSKLIQLTDNISYYGDKYDNGELHFKFYHDNSLFGIHFRDSTLPGLQGILFAIDLWNGKVGRYPGITYTTYLLNQWTELKVFYNISLGWMFEINGVRFGDGYSFSFEHENPSGLEFIQWRSAYSGGGNGYLRLDDIAFYYVPFDITQFKENIQNSPDECWKKPAQNRKNTINNMLTELQELIDMENFEDAYDKLLHDIKPKLTGLKTDENEQPWGNGIYDKAWVICETLREQYRIACNLILEEINPQVVYDNYPPTITIDHVGLGNTDDPGVWNVYVEDPESGIDTVTILVDGNVVIFEEQLGGVPSHSFNDIAVPAVADIHTITVIAKDSNQNEIEITQQLTVYPGEIPGPGPIIIIG